MAHWGKYSVAVAKVRIPDVSGPTPVTEDSKPFCQVQRQQVPLDLSSYGYVEEEYFISGAANVYRFDDSFEIEIWHPDFPYTNRILVRRPTDPKNFSGNVVVNFSNQSRGHDAPLMWHSCWEYFLENGDAVVIVTMKPVCVKALQAFDPDRYARLSWPNPVPADETCDPMNPILPEHSFKDSEDGLAWDIMAHQYQPMRPGHPGGPSAQFRSGSRAGAS
ncbi:MAG: hypothetical protein JRH15_20855 [Deltaproteobacteria bacterium]|nr:hypothetical protein [Deltaproteobacteria bacterium]